MFERLSKIAHVDVPIRDEQELRQRELPFAEDPERAGHRLALVALLDDGGRERVVAGLAVRPEPFDRGHDERKERRQQVLQQVADEEVLLPRLADDGGRKNRVGAVRIRCTSNTG